MDIADTVMPDVMGPVAGATDRYQVLALDEKLRFLARAHTKVLRAIGQGFALMTRDKAGRLGYRRCDYVRERLGISVSQAYKLAHIEEALVFFPETDRQWAEGRIGIGHVQEIIDYVPREEEFLWAKLAAMMTVRRFKDRLVEQGLKPATEDEEAKADPAADVTLEFEASAALMAKMAVAREIANRISECDLKPVEALDAWIMEFHSGDALNRLALVDDDGVLDSRKWSAECRRQLEELQARNEREWEKQTGRWAFLDWHDPDEAVLPDLSMARDADGWSLDERLRSVVAFGQELNCLLMGQLWRANARRIEMGLGFASLKHYAEERLGMSETVLRDCLRLHSRLLELPDVHDAYRTGVLTKCRAERVAQIATPETSEAWIEYARQVTVLGLGDVVQRGLLLRASEGGGAVQWLPPLLREPTCEKARRLVEAGFARVPGGERDKPQAEPEKPHAEPVEPDAESLKTDHRDEVAADSATKGVRMNGNSDSSTASPEMEARVRINDRATASGEPGVEGDGTNGGVGSAAGISNPQIDGVRMHGKSGGAETAMAAFGIDDAGPETGETRALGEQPHLAPAAAAGESVDLSWLRAQYQRKHGKSEGTGSGSSPEVETSTPTDPLLPGFARVPDDGVSIPEPAGRVRLRIPQELHDFVNQGLGLCHAWLGAHAPLSACIELIVDEFLGEYGETAREAAKAHPITERDNWKCTVPGCSSRVRLQSHHLVFVSRGGGNELENQTTMCAFHHLQCLHLGYIEAQGEAPFDIAWLMGIRPDGSPTEIFLRNRSLCQSL